MSDYNYLLKSLFCGDSGVGKSCILLRHCDDKFSSEYISTIGVDFKVRQHTVDDSIVKMQMWDTAGQERFRTITSSYYRGAHIIFLVYDVTSLESFNNIKDWLGEVIRFASEDVTIVLLANKIDLESMRVVDKNTGQDYASGLKLLFYEVSAKEGTNIDDAVIAAIRAKLESIKAKEVIRAKEVKPVADVKKSQKKPCNII